jgi:hypothetical protein
MARFSIFSLTIFMVLAAIALSMPTKRDNTGDLTPGNIFAGLKVGPSYKNNPRATYTNIITDCHEVTRGLG